MLHVRRDDGAGSAEGQVGCRWVRGFFIYSFVGNLCVQHGSMKSKKIDLQLSSIYILTDSATRSQKHGLARVHSQCPCLA